MAMSYTHVAIPDHEVPVSVEPLMQHALHTYVSETNKVVSVWSLFSDAVRRCGERSLTVDAASRR